MKGIRKEHRKALGNVKTVIEVADGIVAGVDDISPWQRAIADVWATVAEVVEDKELHVKVFRQIMADLVTDQEVAPGVRRTK